MVFYHRIWVLTLARLALLLLRAPTRPLVMGELEAAAVLVRLGCAVWALAAALRRLAATRPLVMGLSTVVSLLPLPRLGPKLQMQMPFQRM